MQIEKVFHNLRFIRPSRRRKRGRLVRHYFFIFVILVGGGMAAGGLLETYFRYYETQEQLARLKREVASQAALKIEEFINNIEAQMKAAAISREMARGGLSARLTFDLKKLLFTTPALTEVAFLGLDGVPKARVSRVRFVVPETEQDYPHPEVFRRAREGAPSVGPVYFVQGSEPYTTVALPIERIPGEIIGVLQAEVNLRYIWEVIQDVKVGKAGYAYIVTRAGDLIAHPDLSLVLRRLKMAQLPQVKAAFIPSAGAAGPQEMVSENLQGDRVFSSYRLIPALDWALLIEQPVHEAYEPLYASVTRTSSLLLVGFGLALLASVFVGRRVVRPLEKLRREVERMGRGDLSSRIDLKTGDEIEMLAEEFNRMAGALQEAYAGLEHKVAQRTHELMVVNARLDEASRHKSQFLANVSHELRTPLNAIIGFTRLVLRKTEAQIPALQRENLQKVLISAEHLLSLINGLLDLSKIEAGRAEIFVESFDIEEVVQVAVSTVEPMLHDGQVRVISEIAPDLPPLRTDREKLKQVVLNLLSNAVKFTERGEIRISASRENGSLKLVVSDTGIGIESGKLQDVFEEFRQVSRSARGKYGGTGLGLAIVKRIVHLLGGEIAAESEVGKGSTFTVTLPLGPTV